MIKQFLKSFFLNLFSAAIVVFACLAVIGVFDMLDTYFGAIGVIAGIVILCLVWIVLISYSEAKRKIKEKK